MSPGQAHCSTRFMMSRVLSLAALFCVAISTPHVHAENGRSNATAAVGVKIVADVVRITIYANGVTRIQGSSAPPQVIEAPHQVIACFE